MKLHLFVQLFENANRYSTLTRDVHQNLVIVAFISGQITDIFQGEGILFVLYVVHNPSQGVRRDENEYKCQTHNHL